MHMFLTGWGHGHKIPLMQPFPCRRPQESQINARIRKGPTGFYPPSGRFVIALWNRKFIPEGLHCRLTPLIAQTYDITVLTPAKEIQISDLSSDSLDGVI